MEQKQEMCYTVEVKEKMSSLRILQQVPPPNLSANKSLEDEINVWLEQEDIHWKQRAKCEWYKMGDQSTKFFHE